MELVIAGSLLLLTVILLAIKKPWHNPARRAEGLLLLKGLRQLLEHLQQHRGLSTGYLGGDHSLKLKVDQTQAAIRADLSNLDASSLACHDRWEAFTDHWSRLERSALSLPVNDNIKQHNQLIANMLQLIEDIAAQYNLLFVTHPGDGVSTLWRELLYTTEWLGQARALGTGIAAAGQSTGVERIRLGFLCERIQALSSIAHTDLKGHNQSGLRSLQEAGQTVSMLLSVIETEFLSAAAPKLAATAYFEQATKAISAQFAVVDEMLTGLQDRV
ncbi:MULTISPECIES: nitrate- and nitrite sensing domain-containing protein [Marinobacter]|jgi:hypothetical protein|uniref:nitrate- and nitrite sensing domain-containing protein n=1 Tax=Marinobacter TaxID=2742 RepID=UPI001109AE7B|nr:MULTISPECIES: nitrate- and nitrite sensing domain-containing protein [Marinobacter]MCK2151300.1 nitrate- and nitrite sensing domain-containing protein [Marinobacter alexandrii]